MRNRISGFSLAAALILAGGLGSQAQSPEPEVRAHESAPPFQIRVETNLVTVRVVVRDAQGHPVAGLHREDFRLLDNGKPREFTGFTVETSGGQPAAAAPAASSTSSITTAPAAPFPQRFVTLFFDDLHLDTGAVGQTRNAAWRYISSALRPDDRVGIVTSSGATGIDFTADRDKLHEVLFKVAAHSRTIPSGTQCPSISEYQAYLMDQRQQNDVIEIAAAEGWECRCKGQNETPECGDAERRMAVAQAAQIWNLADAQSLHTLDLADAVVRRMAAMPGQRILVLVSPGFLTATRGKMVDALIGRALRQNVVVNALDAAGLYTRDARDHFLTTRLDLRTVKDRIENEGLIVQRDVLASVAAGTGGAFFHNSNDFDTGFRDTAQAPEVSYILSFALSDVKLDGSFHTLKVALNNGGHFDIQARRGYFANPEPAEKEPTRNEIAAVIFSQEERQDFPVKVTERTEATDLRVTVHVDIQDLQFRKEGERNINTLTFDTALFDRDGKYVAGKESSLDFRLPDAKLQKLRQTGINGETRFRVAPGTYRIREVVRDTETKKMAALNGSAEVVQAASVSPEVAPASKHGKKRESSAMMEWTPAEFVKAMPELQSLAPADSQDALSEVLTSASQKVKSFFDALPDITAHERIDLELMGWNERLKEEFNYLALPRNGETIRLDEYRTNASGRRVEPQPVERGFVTKGFVAMIIHFHPTYLPDSQFRYLGTQDVDGRATDVICFAQIPGKARVKEVMTTEIRSLTILVQGLAWIDSASHQIVRMRTEKLAPDFDADLRSETTESRFAEVRFKNVPQTFWLPEDVTVKVNWRGVVSQNHHHYSQYGIFRVETPAARN